MIEERCNIWDKYKAGEIVCITTNGFVKKNGRCVMGRGVAAQAKKYVAEIDLSLGDLICQNGNVVQFITERIIAFPVKPKMGIAARGAWNVVPHRRENNCVPGIRVPGWAMLADIEIIERSLWELHSINWDLENNEGYGGKIYLPRPGCGAGCLDWDTQVKPLCEKYGDWLVVCHL